MERNATGEALSPDVVVTLNGEELVAGEDYIVTFDGSESVPSEPGSYDVAVEGIGERCGFFEIGTFTIYPAPVAKESASKFHLVSAFSEEFVLDVAAAMPEIGANVSIWIDNSGDNQLFTLELQDNGYYMLRNVANPELVLDAAGANPQAGANVSTWSYNEGPNQQWVLVPSDERDGYFMIQSVANPAVVLDAAGSAPVIGANVGVWTANGGANQLWTLAAVGAEASAVEQS
jgi:hypothetical protein